MSNLGLTDLQKKEIDEVLANLKLGGSERKLYIALLRAGETTVTPLSKIVNLPVTTVQSILQRLVKFGIITVTNRKSRHLYLPKEPAFLRQLVELQLEEVKNIIPLLELFQAGPSSKTKIRIYDNQRMSDIFHEVLECKSKIMYEIMSPRDFQDILGERFHLTNRRIKKGVFLKSLRVEKWEIKRYPKESHKEKLREVKFLPRELTFRGSIVFWDNSVAFFSNYDEKLACVITSISVRETIQQLFDLLWNISRPMQ